ncbi:peptidylprolyl isomerase [Hyalangium versicolor]|uniref:peptidylprolyl isomerase n=1 Tax=Hyalangium versicolor TaxID=2861190 RepID=UPI001CCEC170|nr:peptidylprolyl isomerase [Hyalangium versicolor]
MSRPDDTLESIAVLDLMGSGSEHLPGMDSTSVPLPEARLSSDEPIRVSVPAPPPLTEEELILHFNQLAREHAQLREREPGEPVEPGDDVQLDIIGYANERLIPFSIRSEMWMELEPQDELPGFVETLAGSAVGDCVGIELVLPESYPVESLRGVRARFMVDLLAAREVMLPDPESEEFLRELGRGNTLPEVMEALGEELLEERSDARWLEARNRVLEGLASRVEVDLPDSLIDEEIRRRWELAEGQTVREKNFSPEETQEALDAWKADPATRAEVERRLRTSLALKAVAERDQLQLEEGGEFGVLEKYLDAYGLQESEVREALANPDTAVPLINLAWHLFTVEHVMEQAEIHFEGEES